MSGSDPVAPHPSPITNHLTGRRPHRPGGCIIALEDTVTQTLVKTNLI